MTEAEYIEQQRQLGCRIHEHQGLAWRQRGPGFAQPVFEFRPFAPGAFQPRRLRALLGYVHQVPDASQAHRTVEFMAMDRPTLASYSLAALDGKKRNQVRQGLRLCSVHRLDNLEPVLEDMRQINISQATRLLQDATFDTPPEAYERGADAWRTRCRRLFALPGRLWWGAFADDHLVAYAVTLHVEHCVFLESTKTHSDAFRRRPTDALYHALLEHLAGDATCTRLFNSPVSRPSLDEFKRQFRFAPTPVHYYYSAPRLRGLASLVLHRLRRASSALHRAGARTAQTPAGQEA